MNAQAQITSAKAMRDSPKLPGNPHDGRAQALSLWMIDKNCWAVTFAATSFHRESAGEVLGYVIQCEDGRWRIEGDPVGRLYAIPQHAVQDLVRLTTKAV